MEDIKLSPNGGAIMASERDNIIIPPEKEIAILKNYYKQLDSRFDQSHCIGKLAESKAECETDQVRYGKVERAGIWDTPCKKDTDCPFFKANKNYPNEYGSCSKGYCEFPLGIVPLGYRVYSKEVSPLCYNCKNPDSFNCCKEQENRKKYPNLKSPDYIFPGDNGIRKEK